MQRLTYSRTPGALTFLGLVLVIVSPLIFMAIDFEKVRAQSNGPPVAFLYGLLGCFFLIGILFLFFRMGVVIDRRRDMLIQWWGFCIPLSRTEHRLSDFKEVDLRYGSRYQRSSSHTGSQFVYVVQLCSETSSVRVTSSKWKDKAVRQAQDLASFLHLPKRDFAAVDDVLPKSMLVVLKIFFEKIRRKE